MPQDSLPLRDAPIVDIGLLGEDPHGVVARLRAETPVIRMDENRYTAIRARDVMALLPDPRLCQLEGRDFVRFVGIPEGAAARFFTDFLVFSNGETHRRRRAPFARSFAHAAARALRPEIRRVADRIMAEMPRGRAFDFVEAVAGRVPGEMIASVLGIPQADVPHFTRLVYTLALAVGPVFPESRFAEIEAAAAELTDYTGRLLAERRRAPREDLLTRLLERTEGEDALGPAELVFQVMTVILGGSDTTRSGFAMMVALLLQHPEQWAAVKVDPALIPGAVAEALRYQPPVGSLPRFTLEPIEIGGITVPGGVSLSLSTLSAMRDPELYADPDRFDIRRSDHPRLHLVFGGGVHRCLGEMLARLELEEALAALIAAAPGIRLAGEAPRMLGFGGIRLATPMAVRVG
ncbi:MAG TPA: cytochrome P450 [Paracoccaceae bacterium]|nr:cytochrome P450 [Paracoccaceae bacterium]